MKRFLSYFFVGIVTLGLTACTFSAPSSNVTPLTFDAINSVNLNVADINISDEYTPPLKSPYIEHTLVNPPYRAAYNLIQSAYKPFGSQDEIQFVIKKASIVTEQVSDTVSLFKFWQDQMATLYTAQVIVEIYLKEGMPPYTQKGQGEVVVTRKLKVSPQSSAVEREEELNHMVELMMLDLKSGLTKTLEENLQVVVR